MLQNSRWHVGLPEVKVPIIPVLAFPDGDGEDRAAVDTMLAGSGCEQLFATPAA